MPLTRSQRSSGVGSFEDSYVKPTAAQLKAQLGVLDLDNYVALGSFIASSIPQNLQNAFDRSTLVTRELTDNPSYLLAGNLLLAEELNLLLLYHWIRILIAERQGTRSVLRIYVLPDDVAKGLIVRDSAKLRSALRSVISKVNRLENAWNGELPAPGESTTYLTATEAADSLYYLFNNTTAPSPDAEHLNRDANYYAVQDILKQPLSLGLKTQPYDYQQRSAAAMLIREAEPKYHMDPRFEEKQGPTGELFYLDSAEGSIVKEAKRYEDTRGGILAENMGSGKTFISLLLIMSTRGHIARLPSSGFLTSSFDIRKDQGNGTSSLMAIAARAVQRSAIPYRSALENVGDLLTFTNSFIPWYDVDGSSTIHVSATTLVIVPENLISHWTDELAKHIEPEKLRVLISLNDTTNLPPKADLISYDIILMSKARFEDEFSPRQSLKRRRDEDDTTRDGLICVCVDKRRACATHPYTTALAGIHFLRVIVDEALGFSKSSFDNKASAALGRLIAERKWLVSGTPSKGLRGVEIDMAINQQQDNQKFEEQTLAGRRARPTMETEEEQIKHFGNIVTNFFKTKPWSSKGLWSRYMLPDKYGKGKPGNLQTVINSLVVRHQMYEVSKEVSLPPLSNRVVYLDACPVDKIVLNLFTVQLVINAITSEREDQDYMFHPKQKTALAKLFQNLRHANFYWTGLGHEDLLKAIETAERYAAKDSTFMSAEDSALLKKTLDMGRKALANVQWCTLGTTHEMGLFVDDFPINLRKKWALAQTGYRSPLLMAASDVKKTQDLIASQIYAKDPISELWLSAGQEVWRSRQETIAPVKKAKKSSMVKGISQSSYEIKETSPNARRKSLSKSKSPNTNKTRSLDTIPANSVKSALKRSSAFPTSLPSAYNEIRKPHLVATSSAKLSYLIDKIMEVHKEEKSIIFYEDANAGYWLAQALDVLEVRHEIYATGIKEALRAEYLRSFEQGQDIRVLLMDLRLGSHGLHLASVTRVFFVNPVWDETIEAQAIKRAHRTGQTKPVYIETLVLRGTLEDQMLQRRKSMTTQEQQETSRGPLHDKKMKDIINKASFLPISEEEWSEEALQCAPLKKAHQLYGREFIDHAAYNEKHGSSSNSNAGGNTGRPSESPSRTIQFGNLPNRPCEGGLEVANINRDCHYHDRESFMVIDIDSERLSGRSKHDLPRSPPTSRSKQGGRHTFASPPTPPSEPRLSSKRSSEEPHEQPTKKCKTISWDD